jgi:hypothetical protein
MAIEATAGYMPLDKVADELATNAMAVKRLIARERLGAVQLGAGGPWRIAASELARYIGVGVPDLKMPHIVQGWFDPADTNYPASVFVKNFIQAASWGLGKIPPIGDGPFVIKTLTPAMLATMTAAPTRMKMPGWNPPTYVDAFHVWAVERIRQIMERLLSRTGLNKLTALYESPEAYTRWTTEAGLSLLKSSITFSNTFPGNPKSFSYSVPLSNILDTTRRSQILQATF